jgi:imidazolonepropionase-like amidohydrolase
VLSLFVGLQGTAHGQTAVTAFVNVTVLPMDGDRVLAGQTVLVQGDRISAVGQSSRVPIPDGAMRIDARGKFLMPGLVDLHVHQLWTREIQLALLKMYVVNGVTTILNLRGTPEHLAFRHEIADQRVLGPTLYTAGPYVNEPFVVTADSVEREVVSQKRAGYDFIKLHGDLSRDAYARLNSVARREGIRVIGHAPRNLGIDALFAEGQYALVHAEEFLYDTLNRSRDVDLPLFEPRIPGLTRRMAEKGIWLMTTLTAYKNIGLMAANLDRVLARPEMRYLPQTAREVWGPATNPYTRRFGPEKAPGIFRRLALQQKLIRQFDSAGVKLLLGTDGFNTGTVPGWSAHDELQELVAAGLSPYRALRAATANANEFLGATPCIGMVRTGCVADLLLLEANPLQNVRNARRASGVMLRGHWLSREALDRLLASLADGTAGREERRP